MNVDAIAAYSEIVRDTTSLNPPPLGSKERSAAIARWKTLLSDLSVENIKGKVADVYADDAFLNDTLKTLNGAQAIETYLVETAETLKYGSVTFEDVVESKLDTYVRWRMVYRSKVLSPKEDIITIGMTHLRFNSSGKVVLHQDFWDSTRGVFEHVPIVKYGIRMVKKRL